MSERVVSEPAEERNGPIFQPHDVRSLRDRVYEDIREAILSGALRPGERIKEREIAAQMSVSTTPVKEALRRLEQAGFIVSQPRRGAIVSTLAQTPVDEMMEIEGRLEAISARLAASRMTDSELAELRVLVARMVPLTEALAEEPLAGAVSEFHSRIRAASQNEFLSRFVEALQPYERRNRIEYTDPVYARLILAEHTAILGALLRRDGEEAERQMSRHFMRAVEDFRRRGTERKAVIRPAAPPPATPILGGRGVG